MNSILAIPLGVRLVALGALGAVVGGLLNLAVYRLAWRQRTISPWSKPSASAPRRHLDRVPIFGWLGLRRKTAEHGAGFWIRPLIVELATAALFAGLYWWWVEDLVCLAPLSQIGLVPPAPPLVNDNLMAVVHGQYLSQIILIALMIVASLIDIDEKTIPDGITVWGTVAGLILAAVYPWSLPICGLWPVPPQGAFGAEFLTFASPNPWPGGLGGLPRMWPFILALGCWSLWCVGLMPRRWNTRHGLVTAVRVFVHRLLAESFTYQIALLWLVGAIAISMAAWLAPTPHWIALFTSLVGVAGGGGVIWTVRVVGGAALRREAMGFGDVTLVAMIGAFLGWQATLVIFFLAPFFGLVIGLVQLVLNREHEIPYGPFLCLAALGVILWWPDVWFATHPIFALGWMIPAVLVGCMALMFVMLLAYRKLREAIG